MKAVFISHNQALTEKVFEALDYFAIRGYTQWTETKGRGTTKGEPHLGNHTWPALNNSVMTIVDDEKALRLIAKLREIDEDAPTQGLRAFSWNVDEVM